MRNLNPKPIVLIEHLFHRQPLQNNHHQRQVMFELASHDNSRMVKVKIHILQSVQIIGPRSRLFLTLVEQVLGTVPLIVKLPNLVMKPVVIVSVELFVLHHPLLKALVAEPKDYFSRSTFPSPDSGRTL